MAKVYSETERHSLGYCRGFRETFLGPLLFTEKARYKLEEKIAGKESVTIEDLIELMDLHPQLDEAKKKALIKSMGKLWLDFLEVEERLSNLGPKIQKKYSLETEDEKVIEGFCLGVNQVQKPLKKIFNPFTSQTLRQPTSILGYCRGFQETFLGPLLFSEESRGKLEKKIEDKEPVTVKDLMELMDLPPQMDQAKKEALTITMGKLWSKFLEFEERLSDLGPKIQKAYSLDTEDDSIIDGFNLGSNQVLLTFA